MRRISIALAILLFGVSIVSGVHTNGKTLARTRGSNNQKQAHSLSSIKNQLKSIGQSKSHLKGSSYLQQQHVDEPQCEFFVYLQPPENLVEQAEVNIKDGCREVPLYYDDITGGYITLREYIALRQQPIHVAEIVDVPVWEDPIGIESPLKNIEQPAQQIVVIDTTSGDSYQIIVNVPPADLEPPMTEPEYIYVDELKPDEDFFFPTSYLDYDDVPVYVEEVPYIPEPVIVTPEELTEKVVTVVD